MSIFNLNCVLCRSEAHIESVLVLVKLFSSPSHVFVGFMYSIYTVYVHECVRMCVCACVHACICCAGLNFLLIQCIQLTLSVLCNKVLLNHNVQPTWFVLRRSQVPGATVH